MNDKTKSIKGWLVGGAVLLLLGVAGFQVLVKNDKAAIAPEISREANQPVQKITTEDAISDEISPPEGFVKLLSFTADSKDYTLGPIPAHWWKLTSDTELDAVHYSGSQPFAWANDVSFDTKLYDVDGVLGTCAKGYGADKPAADGFVHFHGSNENSDVGFWLKHTAVTPFTYAGPPGNPDIGRQVPVGVDAKFPNICEFPAQQEEESNTSDNSLVEIEMTAKKFEFSPNVIRVKEGDTVKMTITSLDVTHGFAINELDVSQRIPAGETTTFEFVASKKGNFRFYCNVVCGIGHSGMVGDIIVE